MLAGGAEGEAADGADLLLRIGRRAAGVDGEVAGVVCGRGSGLVDEKLVIMIDEELDRQRTPTTFSRCMISRAMASADWATLG